MGQKIVDVIFNNMEMNEIWNVVILLIQALILIGQLKLSKKINNQVMTREKGYFLIEKTNLDIPKENDFRDRFNLRNKGKIGFYVIKADVILLSATCIVDGITYKKGQSEEEGFFTEDNRFNKFLVFLDLRESDFEKEHLEVKFIFGLRNVAGYKYTEIVDVRFSKIENDDLWKITKYNMRFEEQGKILKFFVEKVKNLVG